MEMMGRNHGKRVRNVEAVQEQDRTWFLSENAVAVVNSKDAKIERLRKRITDLEAMVRGYKTCLRNERNAMKRKNAVIVQEVGGKDVFFIRPEFLPSEHRLCLLADAVGVAIWPDKECGYELERLITWYTNENREVPNDTSIAKILEALQTIKRRCESGDWQESMR